MRKGIYWILVAVLAAIIIAAVWSYLIPSTRFVGEWFSYSDETTERGYPKKIKLGLFGTATVDSIQCAWQANRKTWHSQVSTMTGIFWEAIITCPGYRTIEASIHSSFRDRELSVHYGEFGPDRIDASCMRMFGNTSMNILCERGGSPITHTYLSKKQLTKREAEIDAERQRILLREWGGGR